jgi:hypothetical protein
MRARLSSPAYEKKGRKRTEKSKLVVFLNRYKTEGLRLVGYLMLLNSSKIPVPLFLRKAGSLFQMNQPTKCSNFSSLLLAV